MRVSRDFVAPTMMESCSSAVTEAIRKDAMHIRSVQGRMGIAARGQMGRCWSAAMHNAPDTLLARKRAERGIVAQTTSVPHSDAVVEA